MTRGVWPGVASGAAALVLAAALLGAVARRLESRRLSYVLQSAALGLFLAAMAALGHPHLLLGVLLTAGWKCHALPRRLAAVARRQRHPPAERGGLRLPWLLAQGMLAAIVYQGTSSLATVIGADPAELARAAAAGFACAAVGTLATLREEGPLEQFISLLTVANGAGVAAIALTSGRLVPFLLVSAADGALALLLVRVLDPLVEERAGRGASSPTLGGEAAP